VVYLLLNFRYVEILFQSVFCSDLFKAECFSKSLNYSTYIPLGVSDKSAISNQKVMIKHQEHCFHVPV
jgi:hypothetical protein